MLLLLLAGYLIFNRPFAHLGAPPIYAGEMILALCLLTSLERFGSAFIEPLRRSWTFRLIAAFMLYCVLRGVIDFFSNGFVALRDSVLGGYAILAFLAPAVLCRHAPDLETETGRASIDEMPSIVTRMLLPATLAAAFWAACVQYGWVVNKWTETKIDFMAMAATVAAWVWFTTALKVNSREQEKTNSRVADTPWLSSERGIACLAAAAISFLSALLVRELPTRAMYLTVVPLTFVVVAAWACTTQRLKLFSAVAGVGVLAGSALVIAPMGRSFSRFNTDYALNQNVDRSLADIEAAVVASGERFEKLVLKAGTGAGTKKAHRERFNALFSPDEKNFQTSEGKMAAHAIQWRAIFWLRCLNYTLQRAPLTGVGFGNNLTNLLRDTPAWPMYIDSMRVDPPNRSPHSVHITVLSRLGIPGFLLWSAILATVFYSGLRACWYHRRCLTAHGDGPRALARRGSHRTRYFDGLTILGVWVIVVWAGSFGVILEGPMGGMWFWSLTGILAWVAPK